MPLSPSGLNAAVDRAAGLLAVDAAAAEREARVVLGQAPGDPRARLILASARRRQGDARGALALLAPLAEAFPRAAQTRYELGVVRAALGDGPGAVAALRQATTLNRDLAEAWRALGDQLFLAGDGPGAEAAFAEHARAAISEPALRPAADAVFAGDLATAERLLTAHIQSAGPRPVALNLLAQVLIRQGRDGDAEPLLRRALELDPAFDGARFNLALLLFGQQRAAEAVERLEPLLAATPASAPYRNLMAASLSLVGAYDRAIGLYEGLLAEIPLQPKIWLNYGQVLRTVGRRQEAVAAFRRAIALAPNLGEAYWSLANLKVAAISPEEESAMTAQLARVDLAADDRLHLHYALGKALEDRGDPASAFAHYAQGARLRREAVPYDAVAARAMMRRSKALLTREFFARRAGGGSPSAEPIFIVGLPRSGSTLIEQILASHSAVEGTMELADIAYRARDIARTAGYPEGLAGLDDTARLALGQRFLDDVRVHRRLGRAFFIDKMPNNFHHIGLIQLILPRSRIIDARRHPLGACFSAFKQHFAQGQAFSYDLADLGAYYRDYVELTAHFDDVLPGRVCRVIYEDLVEDTEGQIRRLLDHCGLPFEPGCLKFYENGRAVRTVSSEQVRRPIFRDGLDQWRRFEPWLEPLKTALGPALEGWRG